MITNLLFNRNITVATRMTSYVGALQPFNASNDEWVLYIQHFEHFILANKIENNDEKCHLLVVLVGAPTYKVLASLCAPKQPGELKFKDICDTRIKIIKIPEFLVFVYRPSFSHLCTSRIIYLGLENFLILDSTMCVRLTASLNISSQEYDDLAKS